MSSEALLRAQYQTIVKERDSLQSQFQLLERENQELRRSVYELSLHLSQLTPTNIFQVGSRDGSWISRISEHSENSASLLPPPSSTEMLSSVDTREVSFKSELKGHNGSVYSLDVSYDGMWIASGSLDKNIHIWKGTFPHKQIACLSGHTQLISGLAWGLERVGESAPPEDLPLPPVLYSTSYDKTVRIWNPHLEVCIRVVRLRAFGTSITSSPCSDVFAKGCAIATTNTPYIYLINHPSTPIDSAPPVPSSASLPAEEEAAAIGEGVNVQQAQPPGLPSSTSTGAIFEKHSHVATCVACLPGAVSLLVGDEVGRITLFRLHSGGGLSEEDSHCDYQPSSSKSSPSIRVLSMQVCDGNSSPRAPPATVQSSSHPTGPPRRPSLKKQSTILAAQFSDNMIRIYEVLTRGTQDEDEEEDETPPQSFLRSLHILMSHTTGNQWPIGLSIYIGSEYRLSVPKDSDDDKRRWRRLQQRSGERALGGGSPGVGGEADAVPAVQKVIAVEAGSVLGAFARDGVLNSTRDLPTGLIGSPVHSIASSDTSATASRLRTTSEDEGGGRLSTTDAVSETGQEEDNHYVDVDDDDDELSLDSDGEDPLAAAVAAIHASAMATLNSGHNSTEDGADGANPLSELYSSSYMDSKELGGRGNAVSWKKSLVVATGSCNGQIFLYDISHVNQYSADLHFNDDKVVIPSWKALNASSSTSGKVYGAVFSLAKKCLISFGSDHSPKVWSITGG